MGVEKDNHYSSRIGVWKYKAEWGLEKRTDTSLKIGVSVSLRAYLKTQNLLFESWILENQSSFG
ncbi:MAG: hypothetical protein PHF18_12955 [Methanosarcina sp.]|uniref:hypothetical protein n=1 Tax=Methanosarcina sp. TaxID=2213 RepID=UPI002608E55D|nr:hypothetical protein [Methanosarcina sp.]MDD3247738.1 hypothetical protein [Methanosarcina sp.]MDD4250443.1 hypothetical protein [Methanosarcina sp.]